MRAAGSRSKTTAMSSFSRSNMGSFCHFRRIYSTIRRLARRWPAVPRRRAEPSSDGVLCYTRKVARFPPLSPYRSRPTPRARGGPEEDSMTFARTLAAAAFALAALPAAAQEVTLKVHHFWPPGAMPPSTLLVPWCDKIAKDSGGKHQVPDLPGDATRRHAAAAHRPGEGRRRRHRLDAARLHRRPLPADGGVRAAVHVVVGRGDQPRRVGVLREARAEGVPRHPDARGERARQRLRQHAREAGARRWPTSRA